MQNHDIHRADAVQRVVQRAVPRDETARVGVERAKLDKAAPDEIRDQFERALLQHIEWLTRADLGHPPVDLPQLDPVGGAVCEQCRGGVCETPIPLPHMIVRYFVTVIGRHGLRCPFTRLGQL